MWFPNGRIVIHEQPQRLKRFRYQKEGQSTPFKGVRSTLTAPTFPSIKVLNYTGRARVVVSFVTADLPHRPHPHRLVGPNCSNGICYIEDFYTDSREPTILSFPGLRIQSCTKREIPAQLEERARFNINPFDLSAYGADDLRRNIHEVRLCFQVIYNPDPQNPEYRAQFTPVVSQPIINNRRALSDVKIHHISPTCSAASGDEKILIICNQVARGDIEIRFYEEDDMNTETLIGLGTFEPRDVHGGVAIAFKTPRYDLRFVDRPTNVFVQLVRPSDNVRSNRIPFQYIPDDANVYNPIYHNVPPHQHNLPPQQHNLQQYYNLQPQQHNLPPQQQHLPQYHNLPPQQHNLPQQHQNLLLQQQNLPQQLHHLQPEQFNLPQHYNYLPQEHNLPLQQQQQNLPPQQENLLQHHNLPPQQYNLPPQQPNLPPQQLNLPQPHLNLQPQQFHLP